MKYEYKSCWKFKYSQTKLENWIVLEAFKGLEILEIQISH